jgi:ferredoxin
LTEFPTDDRNNAVKMQIDRGRCQGHGRCYDLAPGLFGGDDDGHGTVLGDGIVPPGQERDARLAVLNCPERAIELLEGARPSMTGSPT